MADFNKPTLQGSLKDYFCDEIRALATSLAKMFNGTSDTNLPDGTIRWDANAKRFEIYNSTIDSWSELVDQYAINVLQLQGKTPADFFQTDGATSVIRKSHLKVWPGTNPSTVKCELTNMFNGNAIAETDNISKGATVGAFQLDSFGSHIIITASGLTGNARAVLGAQLVANQNTAVMRAYGYAYQNNLWIFFEREPYSAVDPIDLTEDMTDYLSVYITYLTDV